MERERLEPDAAIAMLPDRGVVHTFRNSGLGMMLGADWDRSEVEAAIREHGAELSGPTATAMGHGLCLQDKRGWLFIETAEDPDHG